MVYKGVLSVGIVDRFLSDKQGDRPNMRREIDNERVNILSVISY